MKIIMLSLVLVIFAGFGLLAYALHTDPGYSCSMSSPCHDSEPS